MAIYGSITEANAYFATRLHCEAWEDASVSDRTKALNEATRVIDSLNYKGVKHSVWSIMFEYDSASEEYEKILDEPPTRDEIIAADATQELEFPRGQDTEVPTQIEWACYEIALAFIEGFDPEDAIERTNIIRQGYSSVSTTYAGGSGQEYLVYGIPTNRVWMWLLPYLCDDKVIRLRRAD